MRTRLFFLVLTAVVTVITALPITDYCERAASYCKFRFDAICGIPSYSLDGSPNTPFTPRLVSKSATELIGVTQSTDISPQFLYSYYYVPVFARGFTRTQFQPVTLSSGDGSAIAMEHFQADKESARGQCVRVYFTSYQRQLLGGALENVVVSPEQARRDELCVVFRTI